MDKEDGIVLNHTLSYWKINKQRNKETKYF